MRHVRQLAVAAAWGLLITVGAVPVLAGQSSTNSARIEGRVTDDSGAVLPGVTVSIASPALQAPQLDTATDENGRYRFSTLPGGVYTVTFVQSGFQTVVRQELNVDAAFVATSMPD